MEPTSILQIAIRIGLILATVLYYYRVLESDRPFWRVFIPLGSLLLLFETLYIFRPELYYLSSDARPLLSVGIAALEALLVIVCLRLLTRVGWMRILLFYCMALLISVLSTLLPFALFGLFTGESVSLLVASRWNDLLISLISAVFHISLLIISAELIGQYLHKLTAELRWSQFAPVVGAQAVSLILCVALTQEDLPGNALLITVLAILLIIYGLSDLVLLQSFRAFVKNNELMERLRTMETQQTLQKEYYLSLSSQMSAMKRLRHDYKNSLLTLSTLVERGEIGKALALAKSCNALLDEAGRGIYSGNEVLDAVLSVKAQEAERLAISFQTQLLLPSPLPITDLDLMSVFSNLLDNALEYTRSLPASEERVVEISSELRAGLWTLTFRNTYHGDTMPSSVTTKPDAEAHGHGRAIVRSIVEKYDGTIHDRLEDGMYAVLLTISVAD